jgi:hypothetical protein
MSLFILTDKTQPWRTTDDKRATWPSAPPKIEGHCVGRLQPQGVHDAPIITS